MKSARITFPKGTFTLEDLEKSNPTFPALTLRIRLADAIEDGKVKRQRSTVQKVGSNLETIMRFKSV